MTLPFTPEEGDLAAEADVGAFVDSHLISEILRVKCTVGKPYVLMGQIAKPECGHGTASRSRAQSKA